MVILKFLERSLNYSERRVKVLESFTFKQTIPFKQTYGKLGFHASLDSHDTA